MTRLLLGALVLAAVPAAALAQTPTTPAAGTQTITAVGSMMMPYGAVRGFVLRAAEQMPESEYGFKPTPEVRSFGQMVAHIADAQQMICGLAMGEQVAPLNAEKTATTKAALVAALKTSIATCDRAYQQPDASAMTPMALFGQQTTRLGALAMNAAHSYEHYGNLVTYMRLKGMTPPSSQQGQ